MENNKSQEGGESSRRNFIQQSAVAGMGLLITPNLLSASNQSENKQNEVKDIKNEKPTKSKYCI